MPNVCGARFAGAALKDVDVLDGLQKRVREDCGNKIFDLVREDHDVALYVLPVAETRRGLVVDGKLCDVAEGRLQSNQPLLNGGEPVELFGISMLASDVHVVEGTGLRQLPFLQSGIALVANHNLSVVASRKTLRALLERCRGLQQGGCQMPPPSDCRKIGQRLLPVAKVTVPNRQCPFICERLVERLRSLHLKRAWDLIAPGPCNRFSLFVAKTRFMVSQNGLERLSLE